ncbi:MAG: hypothetical protein K0S97_2336 [Chloroflexota bacterium]|jgi:hypothetical protein|nr:hypothetical protein [Chloroflexota bacterium]
MAEIRRCIGSTRYGIEAHEAPVEDFPAQPSQKDGLGRMCKTHWNQYTAGLARDARARKVAEAETELQAAAVPDTEAAVPVESKRPRKRKGAKATTLPEETSEATADAG